MKSRVHDVIQSVGIVLSLTMSVLALGVSWFTYRQSNEDVAFSVYTSPPPLRMLDWTDNTGITRFMLDREYTMLLTNRSTQSTSVVAIFVRDSRRKGDPGYGPDFLEGGVAKSVHPVQLGAGETKELSLVSREFIPIECSFPELKGMVTKTNWDAVKKLFDQHKRTFPYCDPFRADSSTISHEDIIFTLETARGLTRTATNHEFVDFNPGGAYRVTIFTPDSN